MIEDHIILAKFSFFYFYFLISCLKKKKEKKKTIITNPSINRRIVDCHDLHTLRARKKLNV